MAKWEINLVLRKEVRNYVIADSSDMKTAKYTQKTGAKGEACSLLRKDEKILKDENVFVLYEHRKLGRKGNLVYC